VRVAVLPRDEAATVITSGLARAAWAVNAGNLALTIPLLAEFMIARGLGAALPVPLALLAVLLVTAVGAAIAPRPLVVALFLIVGFAGAVLYELSLLRAYPDIVNEGFFVLNRPAVSLVLVGVISITWVLGLLWTFIGFLASTSASVTVALITGTELRTGWGPLMMLALYVVSYLVLAGIQRSQHRAIPDFEQLEQETRRMTVEEGLRSRLTAAVHDTLLNDLSLVMNGPDTLDTRVTERLRADIATLTSSEWLRESANATLVDEQDAELRNRIMVMVSDLQWRGLTVHVTGSGSGIYRLAPAAAVAVVEAISACLENVLRHSGVAVAELDLAYTRDELTVMITDQGSGFDPSAIQADRLGVRLSILDRVEAVGGSAKIWSSTGAGTSVIMRLPVTELRPHEEPVHQEPVAKGPGHE